MYFVTGVLFLAWYYTAQWNLSSGDTLGTKESVP